MQPEAFFQWPPVPRRERLQRCFGVIIGREFPCGDQCRAQGAGENTLVQSSYALAIGYCREGGQRPF